MLPQLVQADAAGGEHTAGDAIAFAEQAEQDVRGADGAMVELHRLEH